MPAIATAIRTAQRVDRFTYAIRNIVVEAKKVEQAGTTVRYLNIGDPNQFGFLTPPHLIEAVDQGDARRAQRLHPVAGHRRQRGKRWPRTSCARASGLCRSRADHVGHVGRHRAGAHRASSTKAKKCSCRRRPIRSTRRCSRRSAREPVFYRTDHTNDWLPDLDHIRSLITAKTRALVVIDPNNPTGAIYPDATRRALIESGRSHGLVILADEVYGDLAVRRLRRRRWRRSTTTRRSFPTRACRRRISRPAGARDGWRWARRRGSTTRWRRSRSWPTDVCAARGRCNTR